MNLLREDLSWCVRRLPSAVVTLLKSNPSVCVAGGFIRSCIANETINDIDLFVTSSDQARAIADILKPPHGRIITTENAHTVIGLGLPVQIIHRWTFESPSHILPSFDFTIAQAVLWHSTNGWESLISERYYQDLASRRLIYTSPTRIEEVGGSLLRVLKFYQRGYRIQLDSLGAVVARLTTGVKDIRRFDGDEPGLAKILSSLLRLVDPNVDPLHESHLPSTTELTEDTTP